MVLTYRREPLEDDEIVAFRRACKTFEEKLIANVLLETGMRVSELTHFLLCFNIISLLMSGYVLERFIKAIL